jgi:hypothetical protein
MKEVKITNKDELLNQIYPVIYDNSMLFLDDEWNEVIIIKDNSIKMDLIENFIKEEKTFLVPDNQTDNQFLNNLIDFYYQRLLYSDHEFKFRLFKIIEKIKIHQDQHLKVTRYYQAKNVSDIY